MTRVYLVKRTRKNPSGAKARTWLVKWADASGKWWSESIGSCEEITASDAKKARSAKESALNGGESPVTKPGKMTLAQLEAAYTVARKQGEQGRGFRKSMRRLDEATLDNTAVTMRYMRAHFGDDAVVADITSENCEAWLAALQSGKLAHAVKVKRKMGAATVRRHIRSSKAVLEWARAKKHIFANPMQDFDGSQGTSATPYIEAEIVERVIAASTIRWRAAFALCRYAGLRVHEAVSLPWSGKARDGKGDEHPVGVDFDAQRIRVVGKGKRYREVPLVPGLAEVLREVAREPGDVVCGLSRESMGHGGRRCIEAAGLKPWRKVFQALRKSCEDDWKAAGVAEATYAAFMGHSPNVSRKHYVTPTPAEFEQVTRLRLVG